MNIQVIDIESMQIFSADEMQPIVLHRSEGLVARLLCLAVGQKIGSCVMTTRVLSCIGWRYSQPVRSGSLMRFSHTAAVKK